MKRQGNLHEGGQMKACSSMPSFRRSSVVHKDNEETGRHSQRQVVNVVCWSSQIPESAVLLGVSSAADSADGARWLPSPDHQLSQALRLAGACNCMPMCSRLRPLDSDIKNTRPSEPTIQVMHGHSVLR